MNKLRSTLTILMLFSLYGCATILSKTDQVISVNSNVQGAMVYIDGQARGKTPFSAQIIKKSNTQVMIKADGYNPQTMTLSTTIPTAFWGNALTFYGSFMGSTTDYLSGAVYEYSPNNYFFQLDKISKGTDQEAKIEMLENEITQYTLINHKNLQKDIIRGEGEYITSLFKIAGQDENKSSYLEKLKTIAKADLSIIEFSKQITEETVSQIYKKEKL